MDTLTIAQRKANVAHLLLNNGLSRASAGHCLDAFSRSGKFKGFLKRNKPRTPEAAAAWVALMLEANPLKVSSIGPFFMSPAALEVYDQLTQAIEGGALGTGLGDLDYDRVQLERLGVY